MIEVELPDGSIAEFPDGTPPETIKGVLQRKFGGPQAPASQAAPEAGGWSPQTEADMVEKIQGTGTFSDMTNTGVAKAVPFGDEIASGMTAPFRAAREWWQGEGFDIPRAYDRTMQVEAELQKRRSERSPIASTAGAVVGAVGASAPIARGASFLAGAKPTLPSMMTRGAAEGATYGAAYGAGEGRGLEERGYNALRGAGMGAVTGAATGAIGRIGAKSTAKAAPTTDQLRTVANNAYNRADQAGVIFTPQAVNRLKADVGKKLVDIGYDPALQPGAAAVVKRIDDMAGQNVTLKGLDSLRKVASNGFIPGNKSNNKAVGDIIDAIDNLVMLPRSADVLTGNAKQAAGALKVAREAWSRLSKAERVSTAVKRAELRAASTGSGGNVDNAIRQNLRRVLENPRGFTPAEQAQLQKVVEGTPGQNALRLAGKLSPQGNGLMAALGIGGTMVNPAIGVASLGGMASKTVADSMTRSNVQLLDQLIRSGGKLPPAQLSAIRQALVQALTRGGAASLPVSTSR